MDSLNNPLSERLLGQHVPDSQKLARHRQEIEAMFEREERRLTLQNRFTAAMWLLVVAMGTMYALVAGWAAEKPVKVYFSIGVTLLMLLIGGAVQIIAGFVGRARLEVTKDVKGLELRLIEIERLLRGGKP
ncbi:MAG: hypothetical protein U0836_05570 [Pirellulales bacterium]